MMENDEIINALRVMSTVMKKAGLAHEPADRMIETLKKNPMVSETEVERAFCAGFLANMKSMADFDGDRILKKFEAFKKSGFYRY